MMGVLTLPTGKTSTCLTLPFARPDLTAFARLDELGLVVVGQRLEPARAVLACRVLEPDQWCRRCGCEGGARDSVVRRLAHEPLGWRPTTLEVTVRRYRCPGCGHVWRQDTTRAAQRRAKISRRGLRWALEGLVCQHLTVARVAEGLGVSWNTANDAVLAEGTRALIEDPARFDGVRVIGVDEHVWRHTRRGDTYVTVIIDLTPIRCGSGPARLLDMIEGRSKQAFKQWLDARPQAWRSGVEVVAMDGFTGFKTATTEELPAAVAVMDPFHVVRLAGDALDRCRRRIQQDTHGHRGRTNDPLYRARRTLHTGADLLTTTQTQRLHELFTADEHVQVEDDLGRRNRADSRTGDRGVRGQDAGRLRAVHQGGPPSPKPQAPSPGPGPGHGRRLAGLRRDGRSWCRDKRRRRRAGRLGRGHRLRWGGSGRDCRFAPGRGGDDHRD